MNVESEDLNSSEEETKNDDNQYLTFLLDNKEYGVDIKKVMEIRGYENPTILPNSPSYINGIVNIRGIIIPVIDLRDKFSIEKKKYSKTTVVIVVQIESNISNRIVGLIVDAVSDVYSFTEFDIKPAPQVIEKDGEEYFKGIVSINDKMIVVFDVEKFVLEDSGLSSIEIKKDIA